MEHLQNKFNITSLIALQYSSLDHNLASHTGFQVHVLINIF